METPTRDTSQTGNFENFRNATYNGRCINLTSTWFLTAPQAGRLHFDFVTTSRPVLGVKPISNRTMRQFITGIFIQFTDAQKGSSIFALAKQSKKSSKGDGGGNGKASKSRRRTKMKGGDGSDSDDDNNSSSGDDEDGGGGGRPGSPGGRLSMNSGRSSFVRGGKTQVGRTLLQKLHIVHKRETMRLNGSMIGSHKGDLQDSDADDTDDDDDADDNDGTGGGGGGGGAGEGPGLDDNDEERAMRQTARRNLRRDGINFGSSKSSSGRRRKALGSEGDFDPFTMLPSQFTGAKKSDASIIAWLYIIESTWEKCHQYYTDYLNAKLGVAMEEVRAADPYNIMDPEIVTSL